MMTLDEFKEWKKDKVKVRFIDEHGHNEGIYLHPGQDYENEDVPVIGRLKMSDRFVWVLWSDKDQIYYWWADV